jgi:hypothetical protein
MPDKTLDYRQFRPGCLALYSSTAFKQALGNKKASKSWLLGWATSHEVAWEQATRFA